MNYSHDDGHAMNMWQRLYFSTESAGARPAGRADAWRRLLAQLRLLKRSDKISEQLYTRLVQQFAGHYCQVIDNQEPEKGLNNFAETVLTLVSGHRNESQDWTSSLSLHSLQKLPIYNSLMGRALAPKREHFEEEILQGDVPPYGSCAPLRNQSPPEDQCPPIRETYGKTENSSIADMTQHSAILPNSSSKPKMNEVITSSQIQILDSSSSSISLTNGPGHSPFDSKFNGKDISGKFSMTRENINELPSSSGHSGIKRKATSPCPGGDRISSIHGHQNPGKRVHPHGTLNNRGPTCPATENNSSSAVQSRNFQFFQGYGDTRLSGKTLDTQSCSDDAEQESKASSDFITAKQKYVIDSKKKNFQHEGDSGFLRQQGAINNANYGNTRRTLGTRRGPSRQFIPPVLNRGDDVDGLQRGAVCSATNPNYSGKNQNVSNDPEVDERLKNIEPRMVELITNEIMDHGPPLSWDDIAGLEFAKNVIKEIVVWPMLRPDIFKGLRGPPKGILLFGPPGTGKTLIGKCIASQSKATFFSISASSLTSKWVGEGEKMVRALFAVARCHLPAVIFIDEIDSLLSQRTDGEHDASRRIKTEFLVQLDGATTNSDERLLVVGATNRPQEIDEAARRRLVKRLYIPLPEAGAREQIMSSLLSQQKCSLSQQEISNIVQQTHGYSGSDMANLCREAALGPIRSITDIQCIDADQVRPILFEDFDEALHQVRASVSEKDLDLYVQWNKLYGSGTK
ncbi:fidgetin-like protein 1 [Oculina patagonica]